MKLASQVTSFLFGLLIFPAFASQGMETKSIDQLILELQSADNIELLTELGRRGKKAGKALPILSTLLGETLKDITENIKIAHDTGEVLFENKNEIQDPGEVFFVLVRVIGKIADPNAPGATEAVNVLIDTFRYYNGIVIFQHDHVDIVEPILIKFDRAAIVPIAESFQSETTYRRNILSNNLIKVLRIIADNVVKRGDLEALQELKHAQTILQETEDKLRSFMRRRKWIDPQLHTILPASINALENLAQIKESEKAAKERWIKVLYIAIGLIAVNFLIILLATRLRWARKIIFHPVGSHVLGLVIGKYLFIDFVMHFVKPIRLAMFHDYRDELKKQLNTRWENREYIYPEIDLESEYFKRGKRDEKDCWSSAIDVVQRSPKNKLWLVQGESGLGKTALFEQWAMEALNQSLTPILLRLGSGLRVDEELTSNLFQYGEFTIKEDAARNLINAGGFLILIDGFNEDLYPGVTQQFVRRAIRNNCVVMSSQFRPDWDRLLDIVNIDLRPFGRDQLLQIISEKYVNNILDESYLRQVASLPYTAQLLANFIEKNKKLPYFRIDLYEDMFGHLEKLAERDGMKALLPNLYLKAADLFFENGIYIIDDEKLPKQFCNIAVDAGILTRIVASQTTHYRFAHELIHRYCMAVYMHNQPKIPLDEWHQKCQAGQQRIYWTNVFDFLGELQVRQIIRGEISLEYYQNFLRDTAAFSHQIFSATMYLQADRFQSAKLIQLNHDFVAWSARTLAKN